MNFEEKLTSEMLAALDILIHSIELGPLGTGTSVSNGVAKVQIDGKWFEIQLRLESDERSFIGETDIVQTVQIGDQIRMS